MKQDSTLMDVIARATRLVWGNKLMFLPLLLSWLAGNVLSLLFAPSMVEAALDGQVFTPQFLLFMGINGVVSLAAVSGVSETAWRALQGESFSWEAFWSGVRRFFFPMLLTGLAVGAGILAISMLAIPIMMMSPLLVGLFVGAVVVSFFHLWQVVMVHNRLAAVGDTIEQSLAFLKRNFWALLALGGGYSLLNSLVSWLGNPGAQHIGLGQLSTNISSGLSSPAALIAGLVTLGMDLIARQTFFVYYSNNNIPTIIETKDL